MFSNRIFLFLLIVLVSATEEEASSKSAEKDSKQEETSEGTNSEGKPSDIDCSKVPDLSCSDNPPPYCHRCDGSGDALMRCSHCHGMCENEAHKMCKQCFGSEMFFSFCCCKDWSCDCEADDEDSEENEDNEDNGEKEVEEDEEEKVNALAAEQDVEDTVTET